MSSAIAAHPEPTGPAFSKAFDDAKALCAESRWAEAAVIAATLTMHEPRSANFAFLAGTCMQRLGQFEAAAALFSLSLMAREQPISVFRIGECLAAAGEFDSARNAFATCFEMCGGKFEYHGLQDAAAAALANLSSIH